METTTENMMSQRSADELTTADKLPTAKPKGEAATGLRELLVDELKDIYWAEQALTSALPKMAQKAQAETLRTALEDHLVETANHIQRLEEIFAILGESAEAKKCEAMAGLIKEGEMIMESTAHGPVRDAGIISAGQKAEHYEIATYGTLAAFAKLLGEHDVVGLLDMTLQEEKAADSKLTLCAETSINLEAASEDTQTM